jgi:hypothetical protein
MAERTTSLFALSIADVLIINMWTNDVGRNGASNYALLKDIFEVSLRLLKFNTANKILFIIRDFAEKGNNREQIKNIIKNNIKKIWS